MRDLVAKAGFVVLAGAVLFGASVTGLAQPVTVRYLTLVRDIDKQARIPFQTSFAFWLGMTSPTSPTITSGIGTTNIPGGKMLVVEYVSASSNKDGYAKMLEFVLESNQREHFLEWKQVDLGSGPGPVPSRFVVSAPVRMYATNYLTVRASAISGVSVKVNITGYLVDAPTVIQ